MKKLFKACLLLTSLAAIGLALLTNVSAQLGSTESPVSENQKYLVEKVLSADRIRLESGLKVRLIGLKAPPLPPRHVEDINENKFDEHEFMGEGPPSLTTTIEERALNFAKELLEGQNVILEFDADKKDRNFDTLAYVFLASDKTFVNVEILRQGYANLSLTPPNLKHQDQLRLAYQEARQERRGLHEDN